MSISNRYLGASAMIIATSAPASAVIVRHYGRVAARRFCIGMSTALVAQQAFVGLAVDSKPTDVRNQYQLNLVDLMTLTRSWAASLLAGLMLSGVRDRRGVAGWMGWIALLYGAILCDWLDGPVARHFGTSEVGAMLDREADSWLTLCSGAAAVTWGDLPITAASAPLLRYALTFEGLRTMTHADLHSHEPGWVRLLGITQMLLFIAALAPFQGRATSFIVRLLCPLQTPLQLGGLVVLRRMRRRR